jgi:hypothetical protein
MINRNRVLLIGSAAVLVQFLMYMFSGDAIPR